MTIIILDKEIIRLKYALNLRPALSRLPVEVLAEVLPHVVESGLRDDDTCFAARKFTFLRVCRRWNEVAGSFPQLWG
jgi:hypothetical protein